MYNDRPKQKAVKNQKKHNVQSSKTLESYCSCPNNPNFKRNQSEDKYDNDEDDSKLKTQKQNEKLLRSELKKYGLKPKKSSDLKNLDKVKGGNNNSNEKNVSGNKKVKGNSRKGKTKAKTDPNLEKYVDGLKKEIRSSKGEIPSLPGKYKDKYLESLKEEVFLNKLSTHHEKRRILQNLQTEIKEYRECPCWRTEIRPDSSPFQGNITKELLTNCTSSRSSSDASKEMAKRKIHKKGTSDGLCSLCATDANRQKPMIRPVASTKDETVDCKIIARNSSPTVCGQNYMHMSPELLRNLEMIRCLIPQMSSVIQKAESGLGRKVSRAQDAPKTVEDRGASPILELPEPFSTIEILLKCHELGTEEQPTIAQQRNIPLVEPTAPIPIETENDLQTPFIGDLLANIENIRESKCLLTEFQNELSQIKEEIRECKVCNSKSEKNDIKSSYCENHATYIPLLRIGDMGSRSEQIELFSILKTEISLKKQLENQLENIAKFERELSNVKISQNEDDIKIVEQVLELSRSYFNNLLVKQETERLLHEQQKILRMRCESFDSQSSKYAVQKQIHNLLGQVRTSINTDLKATKQRLQVQKMPSINIPTPLQPQKAPKLSIPESSQPLEDLITNVESENIVAREATRYSNKGSQTQTSINSAISVEMRPRDSKPKTSQQTQIKPEALRVVPRNLETQADNVSGNSIGVEISLKSPSELDFVRTQQTQCDSNSSLNGSHSKDPIFQDCGTMAIKYPAKKTVDTQTTGTNNDSNYLFGFREYLMHKAPDLTLLRNEELTDASLQVSIGSIDENVVTPSVALGCNLRVPESKYEIYDPLGDTFIRTPFLDENNESRLSRMVPASSIGTDPTLGVREKKIDPIDFPSVRKPSQDENIKSSTDPSSSVGTDPKLGVREKRRDSIGETTVRKSSLDEHKKSRTEPSISVGTDPKLNAREKRHDSTGEITVRKSSKGEKKKSLSKTEVTSNTSIKKSRRTRSNLYLERPPSVKKMYMGPSPRESRISASISNPNLAPKYRMKPYSITEIPGSSSEEDKGSAGTQEENGETEDEDPGRGLEFYRALVSQENLPERRPTICIVESPEEFPIGGSSEAIRSIDLSANGKSDSGARVDVPDETSRSIEENDIDDKSQSLKDESVDINENKEQEYEIEPEEEEEMDIDDEMINEDPITNNEEANNENYEKYEVQSKDIEIDLKMGDEMSIGQDSIDSSALVKEALSIKEVQIKSILIGSSPKHDNVRNLSLDFQSPPRQSSSEEVIQQKTVEYQTDKPSIDSILLTESDRIAILQQTFRDSFSIMNVPPKINVTSKTLIAKNEETPPEDQGNKTVLSVFPPTYRFIIDHKTTKLKKPLFDDNVLLHGPVCFKSRKSFNKTEVSNDFSKNSDDFRPLGYHDILITNGTVENVVSNGQLPLQNARDKCLVLSKLAKQRAEYLEKCSYKDYSTHSNMSTSEGEVRCNSRNISEGEFQSCTRGKINLKNIRTGIQHQKKLSSPLVLQTERKRFNDWVTHYPTKKKGDDSSTSSGHCDKKRKK